MKAALVATLAALAVGSVLPPGPFAPDALPSSAAAGAAGCRPGFTPRLATPEDTLCVGHLSRDRVVLENRRAAERRDPASGACRDGFVPREAVAGDAVCIAPRALETVRIENARSALRPVAAAR